MVQDPLGFRPSRNLVGGGGFRSKKYTVASTNGQNLFIGDAVKLVAGFIEAVSGAGEFGIGVIKACYTATGRPLTHSQPDNGPFRRGANSAANIVDVYDDPNTVFQVQANATAAIANIGQVANLSAGVGNTNTGLSGHELNIADATAAVSAGAAEGTFRIIGLAPVERGVFASANDVEVIFDKHVFGGGL